VFDAPSLLTIAGGEFPPYYSDFDLLADFLPSMDFLTNIPEEPLSLSSFLTRRRQPRGVPI